VVGNTVDNTTFPVLSEAVNATLPVVPISVVEFSVYVIEFPFQTAIN
jgi:hypothetical protein